MPCGACIGRRVARVATPRPARTSRSSAGRRPSSPSIGSIVRATIRAESTGGCSRAAIAPTSDLATDRAVLPTTIVLDASASMAFPTATREKWRRAQELAVGLAAVAHADGDPVGVVVQEAIGRMRVVPPRTRRGVVGEIARVVDACRPEGTAPLAPAVAPIHTSRIAIVTDLLGDADELLRVARVHVVAGGEFHVVHVVAREEIDPPRRPILAADPEQPELQRLLADATRAGYDAHSPSGARRWRARGARPVRRTPKS